MTGVYSDLQIIQEKNKGNVVIEPFNSEQLNNCSYDVKLGEYYYTSKEAKTDYLCPWVQETIDSYWGEVKKAKTSTENDDLSIPIGYKYIVLEPGELILAHTEEFIGTKLNATTMLKAKSTMGRCGISVCKCAGLGDIGFFNRYVLEIENHAKIPIILLVGQRIAQVVFCSCGETNNPYHMNGTYQKTDNLEELISNWKPELMLPKAKINK